MALVSKTIFDSDRMRSTSSFSNRNENVSAICRHLLIAQPEAVWQPEFLLNGVCVHQIENLDALLVRFKSRCNNAVNSISTIHQHEKVECNPERCVKKLVKSQEFNDRLAFFAITERSILHLVLPSELLHSHAKQTAILSADSNQKNFIKNLQMLTTSLANGSFPINRGQLKNFFMTYLTILSIAPRLRVPNGTKEPKTLRSGMTAASFVSAESISTKKLSTVVFTIDQCPNILAGNQSAKDVDLPTNTLDSSDVSRNRNSHQREEDEIVITVDELSALVGHENVSSSTFKGCLSNSKEVLSLVTPSCLCCIICSLAFLLFIFDALTLSAYAAYWSTGDSLKKDSHPSLRETWDVVNYVGWGLAGVLILVAGALYIVSICRMMCSVDWKPMAGGFDESRLTERRNREYNESLDRWHRQKMHYLNFIQDLKANSYVEYRRRTALFG